MGIKGGEDPRVGFGLWEDAWVRRGQVLAVDDWGLADRGQIPVQRSGDSASGERSSSQLQIKFACPMWHAGMKIVFQRWSMQNPAVPGFQARWWYVRVRRVGRQGVPRIWRLGNSWSGCKSAGNYCQIQLWTRVRNLNSQGSTSLVIHKISRMR